MSDLSARLEGLSLSERAALREIFRRRRGGEARPPEAPGAASCGAWEEGGTAPASFAQERFWLIDQLTPGTAIYNIPGALRLRGPLDIPALAGAVSGIVRRQASLRTVFAAEAGRPVQRIHPWVPPALPLVDLSALPDEAREAEVLRRSAAEAERPFDLERGPLFRIALLILGPREHVALYTMHHIVSDGWSMNVFFRELAFLYEALAKPVPGELAGRPSPLPALPRQVADLAIEQRSRLGEERLAVSLAWWRERLASLEPLELPTDRPRPPARSGRGALRSAVWPPELARRLAAWARGENATLYMVLLAAFQALLSRITGQDDVAVGSPVANRTTLEMESLIGCFINTVVLRTDLAGDPPLRELLARVRATAVEAYRHQEVPFERVVEAVQPERQLARPPLFQVLFVLQNIEAGTVELPGLSLERVNAPTSTAKLDLSLSAGETPAGLEAHLEIDLDLFEPATADRLLRHLRNLLEGALDAPETRLSDLPLLGPAEREEILVAWNRTAVPIPRSPVHRLFEEQVDRAPDTVAVIAAGEEMTYAQLDAQANRLAHRLRRLGAEAEVPVVVLAERSPAQIVALLAVMKSGGFFVPLDPAHPRERLASVISRTGARLAVTAERFLDRLPEEIESVCLDRDRGAIAAEPAGRPDRGADGGAAAQSLMYVLFTSGSTGEPKGVAVTHGNVARLLFGNAFAEIGPGETYVVLTAVTFDPSILEIWGTLVHGGRLAVLPPELPGLDELGDFLERYGVTQMHLTTALFHQMAERRPERLAGLRRLAVGGEALSPALTGRALEAVPGLLITNCYGPTEVTVISSVQDMSPEEVHRPTAAIGRPVANTSVYVLGGRREPLPVGVWGELYLGGEGVARGYFARPELTAERFVPDPLGGLPGARLYRSGDLVRWRPDGVLDFAGRIDRQVKIRGYRIEPGEIEAALTAHPEVSEAAVLVRGEARDRRLVAYVAVESAASPVDGEGLRRWLSSRLPEPMVPEAVVVLERLPVTSHGKVDRRALEQIAPERTAAGHVEPRTLTEEVLAGLWTEVLGAERTGGRVGIHDNFFELGGHSLLATRLLAAVRDAFRVELPLRALFERPTLVEVAWAVEEAIIAEGARREAPPDEPEGAPVGPAVLSFSQERLWLLEQIDPGTAAYNIPGAFRVRGPLDVAALRRSVAGIVRRHDALRTTFASLSDQPEGQPVQRVQPFEFDLEGGERRVARLPLVDLAALSLEARRAEVRRLARAEAVRPFDLAAGPLFRATLLRLDPREHVALYTMHHIVSDGWSMDVFFREIGTLYAAFAAGRPCPLPPLPLQYADFARRQRRSLAGARLEQGIAAWRRILDGVAALELPTDRPRPVARSWRGASVPVPLGPGLPGRLAAFDGEERSTLFMALLALVQIFLHRLARQDDIAVGTAVANRTDRDVGDLIGFFVNSVVLRTDLSGDPPLREVLRRARRTALEAFQLQEIPFEKIVEALRPERHSSRTPLFQVMLALQNTPQRARPLAGLELEPVEATRETAKFDFSLGFSETPGGLVGLLEYDLDLFDPATAERWSRHLALLIEAAVGSPDLPVSRLPLLAPLEREQIVLGWNRTAARLPKVPVHRLIEEQVDRTPDALAVVAQGEELTYAELDARANRLAHRLRRSGAGPEVPVVVLAERSPDLIAALLAVMKSGGFFVPLDPGHPRERLADVISRSGARLAVTRERFLDLLPEGIESVCLDRDREALAAEPAGRPEGGAAPQSLLYVMFTSGSTGEPKGVANTHANVVRLVRGKDFLPPGPGQTMLMLSPVSFDASTYELWATLSHGGRIAVFPPHTPSLEELGDFLVRQGVTQALMTAALFHQMSESRPESFAGLSLLLAGGDVVAPVPARRVIEACPGLALWNAYGPTESTTVATACRLTLEEASHPSLAIGLPITNTRAHVLEPGLEPSPVGVWGELCLGGEGLARGYLGRADLTAERFVPDPFATLQGVLGARLYRSGDLARRRPDGALEFFGRMDRQVKIRGFRIEPAEVETVLAAHPAVADVAVLVRGAEEDKRLVAYVALAGEGAAGADLRRWLAGRLPEPMVPAAVVVLDRLPVTPHGKVDRRALVQIAPERTGDDFVAPRTPVEEVVAALFVEVLGEERTGGRAGSHDSFFDLGGHSLAATRLASRLRAALGVELPLRAIFEAPTVAALAARCGAPDVAEHGLEIPLLALPRDPAGDPLSFSQERLWFLDRLTPGTSTYNLPSRLGLRGPLDLSRLARCFSEVVRRHEVLRTRFVLRGNVPNQTPVQIVDPPAPFVLPLVDLTGLPEARRRPEAERQGAVEAEQPFDLERGPLVRAVLLRLGAEEHDALLNLHHVVTDGWSMGILFAEIGALYQEAPLPELPLQVTDVARWQREALSGPALEAQLAYWREQLGGAPPSLDLPLDRVRPVLQTFHGGLVPGRLPAELADRLRALAHGEGASLFMVLLAGWGLLLGRLSGQDDVVVGSPVAGRTRPELESLIGLFLNTLALRVSLADGPTFRALLGRARETSLGAYAHQDVPFEKLLEDLQPERDLSRTPLFQVMLNMLSFPAGGSRMPDGLVLEPLDNAGVDSKFDLTIYAGEDAGGVSLSFVYNAGLFDRERIEEMQRQLGLVLEQIAADPDALAESLSLLTPEAAALLPDPRQPLGGTWVGAVHGLFAEQARLHPERPAVSDAEVAWSYGELADAVARLAAHLRAGGLLPQEPVAIWAHRGAPLIQAVFGTLWAGGAFVLLDPAYPPARLAETVAMAAPRYWIQIGLDITAAGAPPAEVEEVLGRLAAAGTLRGRLRLPCELLSPPVEPAAVGPDDAAAITFTSGSTGAPKGIVQRHGSMSHFLPFFVERFGIGPADRFSLLSGLSHDPLQRDLCNSLCLGASLCAPAAEEMTTPGWLAAWMARERITIANLTPAMAQLLTEVPSGSGPRSLPELRTVFLVGDALTRSDVERLRRLAPGVRCVNLYGTTETQRAIAMHLVTRAEIEDPRVPQVLPLGRGIREVQLLVAARDGSRLAGIGEVGEVWMRSPHLARGYLADEALTADRFWTNPFTGAPGDRVYRTGDLGRYRPDGEVTFAGRADQQVKIRGFRIELAEIEAALGRQPGVREAVVLSRDLPQDTPGRPGDRELVAYLVGQEIDPAGLREALRSSLPAYMVPAAFVVLDELPVTPNGKVDRRALLRIAPERGGDGGDGYVAPRTPTEEALAALWVEVLGKQRTGGRIGVQDNFFALGGHSLLATRLIAAVSDAFQVELPLRILFEQPTVEGLARAIDEAGTGGASTDEPVVPVPRAEGVNRFPVSFSQLREWILDRLEPGNPAYNIANNLRIGGPLSVPVLAAALHRLAERHEVFRTVFEVDEEEPVQVVLPAVRVDLPVIDLAALPEAAREAELARRVQHHANTGLDLTAAPLLSARIVRLEAEEHALLMTVHHIVSDGWSMGILNGELAALYDAQPLPPLPVQYADYAVWQRKRLDAETLERQAGYWRQRLTGAPPLLELPTDRPRPPVRSSRGSRVAFSLPRPLARRLEELALRQGATLFMVLLAGYQILLARWSGQDDVVVGTYSGNRPRRELEGLIGFFVNTLVLRTDLAGDPSFTGLLGRVRETTLGAYAHRDLPFEKLLETVQLPRDPSRTPLFQALLVLHNFPPAEADLRTGVRLSALPAAAEKSDYDLSLWLAEGPEGIAGHFDLSTDLFDEATIVRFGGQLRTLLEAAVAEPGRNVWTLPLIGEEEQARQLAAWSSGPAVPEGPTLLHRLVEEQAARTPTAVAVEAGGVRLTYAELVEQARRHAEGIVPGSIVALAAERTPELIVRMLGVLQAGAAYLPIDPAYPEERRAYMLADSGANSAPGAAYLIYTSGSTGRPKGVVVPHQAIASFVRAARETYGIAPGDRVLQFASISFDTSAEEIWPALAAGATLVLRPDEMAASIPHFLRELVRLGITCLDLPTAFWHEMVLGLEADHLELPRGLRLVILGGEEALTDRFALWRRRVGSSVRLVNTYGPTEATIVATRRELSDFSSGGTVPIGRPIAGARAYVLDRFLTPVPPGVRGELWIGGAGVARGYLGRPDLTAERFVPDPFSEQPGERLYRTGDLAVLKPDGDLVFAGRADRQLKVRGYRIEPGEIEAALRLHPALRDAVVDARGDDRRLIAWVVPREEAETPDASDLRAFLRGSLPEPLLPSVFVAVEALPLTPGGKVDRRALPEPADARPENTTYAEPQSALERTIADIYAGLLRVGRVGLHDNFFDLGGHSLLIVRAHQKLKEALGREIPVLDLFRFPTVAALARHLGGEETGSLEKVQNLAEKQRTAQQRQRAAMERLRRPGRRTAKE